VFPLAPLFSFLTNLLEIKIKLNRMSKYSRRFVAQGASGIGSWTGVMELISLVSIPINVAILLFTAKGADTKGDYGYSETVKYVLDMDFSIFEVVLLLVMVEHCLIGLKVMMATLIPDVPKDVEDEERTRPKLVEMAVGELTELKMEHEAKTIIEMMEDITKTKQN